MEKREVPTNRTTYLDDEFRQVFRNLNATERLRKLDVGRWMEYCRDAGATVAFIDMQTQCYGLYDSALIRKAPTLGDRDLGREVSAAARKFGLKWCAYLSSHSLETMAKGHDDWQQKRADGSFESDAGPWKTFFCYNTGFGDLLTAVLREISERYRPHGFFLDGFMYGFTACYCDACKAKYRKEIGKPMPLQRDWDSPDWHVYIRWRYRQMEDIARRVHEAVHTVDPKIGIVWNCVYAIVGGWYAAQSSAQARWMDYPCTEVVANASKLDMDDLVWGCLSNRAVNNGKHTQHFSYFQPTQRRAEAETIYDMDLAVGALPCLAEQCSFLPELMRRVKRLEPYLKGRVSAADIALHRSDAAHNGYYRPAWGTPDPFFVETPGVLKGLQSAHLPAEIILDDRVEIGTLDGFRAVILPNSSCLSAAAVRNLQEYVQAGGTVLASMETGLRDACGVRQRQDLLWSGSGLTFKADIATCKATMILRSAAGAFRGVEDDVPAAPDQFIVFDTDKSAAAWLGESISLGYRPDGLEARESLQLEGVPSCQLPTQAVEVDADENWTVRAMLRFRRSKRRGWEECPAIMTRKWGRGRVTYVNFQFGTLAYGNRPGHGGPHDFSTTGHTTWWRHLIGRLVAETAGPAPVRVKAPYGVRYFIWRQPDKKRYVLHLVNELSSVGGMGETQREDRLPVPVKLKIALPGSQSVRAVLGGKGCRIERTGKIFSVIHPALREHLVVSCTYQS